MKQQLELEIRGMTCDSCAAHVTEALRSVPGVDHAEVPGWESGRAKVIAATEIDAEALTQAVARAGYRAKVRSKQSLAEAATPTALPASPFDLLVIGGGSAGFAAAIRASELGFRVGLIHEGVIGGTCVNIGCVPSKALIRAVETYHQAGQRRFKGIQTLAGPLHWPQVIAHKEELVAELRRSKYVDVLAEYPNITWIEGRARVRTDHRVEVNGEVYPYRKLLLATGASPWIPPIPGLAETPYLTSTSALSLSELPRSLLVLGANAVGLELAQLYARAGVAVTVLEVLPRIVPFEDEAISQALQAALEEEGLRFLTAFKTERVSYHDRRFVVQGTVEGSPEEITLTAEQLLVATGRRANTAGMGLEEAGVHLGRRGEVLVDETLRTSHPDIYAAGDVTGRDMFVYVAAYAGQLAAENALTEAGLVYDGSVIPRVTFTDPQVASVGLTEAQARERGYTIKVSMLPMEHVPRALVGRDRRGLVKLIVNAADDRLLGAYILAPEAGEMISIAVLAMRFGLTTAQLRQTLFPYLTYSEALKLAVLALEKDVTRLSCCAG